MPLAPPSLAAWPFCVSSLVDCIMIYFPELEARVTLIDRAILHDPEVLQEGALPPSQVLAVVVVEYAGRTKAVLLVRPAGA